MRARLIPTFLVCAAVSGCTASVTGEPFGKKFGTAFATASRGSNGLTASYTVTIANDPNNECGTKKKTALADGTQVLVVTIARNGNQLPLSGGTPYVQEGADAWSTIYGCEVTAGQCRQTALTTSSVELTNGTDAKVAGSFTVTDAAGDAISGNFDAPLCEI